MSVRIHDGLSVEIGGEQSLRIMKWEDLIRKVPRSAVQGDSIVIDGFEFIKEMADRYGGKKLKLYKVMRRSRNDAGANFRLVFSSDDSDSYDWSEFMTVEFWESGGRVRAEAAPVRESKPEPRPTYKPDPIEVEECKPYRPAPKSTKKSGMGKMLKMFLLMSLMKK